MHRAIPNLRRLQRVGGDAVTSKRERIAATIRALRAKTVENGCTEAEALSAAQKLADLLQQHDMTLDEAELRESPFERHTETHDDWVGERLWKVADGIAHLTGVRYWVQRPGERPTVTFFGFAHEVDVAKYLLEICRAAMLREKTRVLLADPRKYQTYHQRRRAVTPFLDGMADRLRQRLRDMKPPEPTGTGLVVLRGALIDAAMPEKLKERGARPSRDTEAGYRDGVAAGDRVALNQGLSGGTEMRRIGR